MTGSYEAADQALEAFRFFELPGKEPGKLGDRFLQPWITILIGAGGNPTKGQLKRTAKELNGFFAQPQLKAALELAGGDRDRLLAVHLRQSAEKYLQTSQEDQGYNSILFGLIKLKKVDREKKLAGDVMNGILLPLLLDSDIPYRELLLRAMASAYLETLPEAETHYSAWRDKLKDELRETLDQSIASP